MPVLPERLLDPLKDFSLSCILFCITEKHTAFGQCIDLLLQCCRQGQHAGRNNGDIIEPGFQQRLGRIRYDISVSPVVSVNPLQYSFDKV